MSPAQVITVPAGTGTRVSVAKLFSAVVILLGAYRSVGTLFGWGMPPEGLEQRVTDLFNSVWPALTALGGALWGVRNALK